MYSIALSLAIFPLANIGIPIDALPDSVAGLLPFVPLTVIHFSISPDVGSFSVGFTPTELALISVSVGEQLVATAKTLVRLPGTFVDTASVVDYHTFTFSLPFFVDFSSVN
jgi:hypothetical protein